MSIGLVLLIAAGVIALLGWLCKASSQWCSTHDFTIGCLGSLLFWALEFLAATVGVLGMIYGIMELCV